MISLPSGLRSSQDRSDIVPESGPPAKNTIGDEILPKSCWPDPKQMVDDLKTLGAALRVERVGSPAAEVARVVPVNSEV